MLLSDVQDDAAFAMINISMNLDTSPYLRVTVGTARGNCPRVQFLFNIK